MTTSADDNDEIIDSSSEVATAEVDADVEGIVSFVSILKMSQTRLHFCLFLLFSYDKYYK